MKSISISILVLLIAFTACKKTYQEDTYDFSNSLAPYVEIKTKTAIKTKEDSTIKITVQMRSALQEDVDVAYSITGGFVKQGTVRINRNTLEGSTTITVPVGTVPVGSTSVAAEAKLVSAKALKSNTDLTVGRLGTDKEKIAITIAKKV